MKKLALFENNNNIEKTKLVSVQDPDLAMNVDLLCHIIVWEKRARYYFAFNYIRPNSSNKTAKTPDISSIISSTKKECLQKNLVKLYMSTMKNYFAHKSFFNTFPTTNWNNTFQIGKRSKITKRFKQNMWKEFKDLLITIRTDLFACCWCWC